MTDNNNDLDPEYLSRLNDNCDRLYIGEDNLVRIKGHFVDDDMIFKLQHILQRLVDDPHIIVRQREDGKILLRYKP